ncbi:MAG TPA: helix-turn-helix domain-containing protein [Candidatus Thermoplasmatota archaeon]|nr:helix-turn-helix domain-containing protein [Candidatus Thermoplasmatota archaeon]
MVVEGRIRIRHRGCFTERLVGSSQGAQLAAEREGDVVVLHGPDVASLEALLRAPMVLSRTPTSIVARVRGAAHGPVATIAGAGCTIVWPALFVGGEESYTILAPTRERFDSLMVDLRAHGDVSVERVGEAAPSQLHVNVPLTDITTNLTERQLVVLQKAIAEGYYDSPRRTSTEALAATFGVTRSTLEEHLRKAERRVLEGFAGVLLAQPVLARAAARRPGRPAAKPLAR